jgi:hypothetical protein
LKQMWSVQMGSCWSKKSQWPMWSLLMGHHRSFTFWQNIQGREFLKV